MKHTKEPWHAPGLGEIHAENHDEIAAILFHNPDYERGEDGFCGTEEDAKRIVACVNFCAGVSNDILSKEPLIDILNSLEFYSDPFNWSED